MARNIYKQKGSKNYWIKYYRDGRPFRESSGSEKESDARRMLALREGDIARGLPVTPRMGRVRFEEVMEDQKNDYRINHRKSLKDLERRCDKHLIPFFGGKKASSITTADVREFIVARQAGEASREEINRELAELETSHNSAVEKILHNPKRLSRRDLRKELGALKRSYQLAVSETRKKAGASNGEINRELTALKRAFVLAVQAGKLLAKPYIPMLAENNVRTGFFERAQLESVLKFLPEHVKPVAHFAYLTGWRTPSEILPLQWRQVDFRAVINGKEVGAVRLDPGTTKNKEGRVFPFTQELRVLLEEQKAKSEALRERGILCPWVFSLDGKPFKSFKRSWKTACRRAGLPGKIPHDFRRTAVRNLVRMGIPEAVAMKMTGHKTRSVFERYNIVSEGDLLDAAKRLDDATGIVSGIVGHFKAEKFL